MELKLCSCGTHEGVNPIPINEFGVRKNSKDGHHYYCLICHRNACLKSSAKYPHQKGEYYKKNKSAINLSNNKRYLENREERRKKYHENVEYYRAAQARSRKKRKENGKANQAEKNRNANDVNYKLSQLGRGRRKHALKAQGAKKLMKYLDSLGCTIEFYKSYIESKFLPGMNWDNHGRGEGKWQIDEIRPCAAFNLSDPEQYKECFHYTNAQPLWSIDNMIKGPIYQGVRYVKRKAA